MDGDGLAGTQRDDVLGSDLEDSPGWLQRAPRVSKAVGVAALLAGAVLVGPDLMSSPGDAGDPRPAESSSGPTSRPEHLTIDWPLRGDLADDPVFVPAALSRVRRDRPDADRVLYAAALPDGSRLALVADAEDGPRDSAGTGDFVHALNVPKDSPIYAGAVWTVGRNVLVSDLVGVATRGRNGRVYAVLLGRPGPLVAQVSARVNHRPDGSAGRQWRDVQGADGAAVVDLGTATDPAVFARSRATPAALPILIEVQGAIDDPVGPVEIDDDGLGGYEGPDRAVLTGAVRDTSRALVRLADADIRVIWSGDLRGGFRGALLRIRRIDGPTFQVLVGQAEAGETFAHGPLGVPWADADVMPWVFESGDPSQPLLVINPTGRGSAAVSYPQEPPRVVRFDAEGTAPLGVGGPSAPHLFGATIEVRSPSGRLVVKAALRTISAEDPLVLDP